MEKPKFAYQKSKAFPGKVAVMTQFVPTLALDLDQDGNEQDTAESSDLNVEDVGFYINSAQEKP